MSKPRPIYKLQRSLNETAVDLILTYMSLVFRYLYSKGWDVQPQPDDVENRRFIGKKYIIENYFVPSIWLFKKEDMLTLAMSLEDTQLGGVSDYAPPYVDVYILTNNNTPVRIFKWAPNFFSADDAKNLVKEIESATTAKALEDFSNQKFIEMVVNRVLAQGDDEIKK